MSLMRWRPPGLAPRRSLWDLDRWFADFLDRWPSPALWRDLGEWPSVDVRETDEEVVVIAEVPGVTKDELDVSVTEDALTIRGERRQEKEDTGEGYCRRELQYGRFARTVALPSPVEGEAAKAVHKDGVLEIRLPKVAAEKQAGRKIKID